MGTSSHVGLWKIRPAIFNHQWLNSETSQPEVMGWGGGLGPDLRNWRGLDNSTPALAGSWKIYDVCVKIVFGAESRLQRGVCIHLSGF